MLAARAAEADFGGSCGRSCVVVGSWPATQKNTNDYDGGGGGGGAHAAAASSSSCCCCCRSAAAAAGARRRS